MNRSIFTNSLWLFFGQVLIKGIAFFYTIFLANSLGVENYGYYIAALAYFSLFSSFTDLGLDRYLIREGAKDESKLSSLFIHISLVRFLLGLVLFLGFSGVSLITDPDHFRTSINILAVLAVIPQTIALTLDKIFITKQQVKQSVFASLILSLATTFIGIFLVLENHSIFGAILAVVISQIIYLLVLNIFVQQLKINIKFEFSFEQLKKILKGSLPYGLLAILGLFYFKIDTLLLLYIRGPYETGIYGAAFKFIEAIVFIPTVLFNAVFPALAKLHETNIDKVKEIYTKSLKLLFILSIIITAIFLLILPMIIQIFLPQYIDSIKALKILSFTIPLMFANAPAVTVLFASDKYLKSVVMLSVLTCAFNLILNIFVIPIYGYIGASYTTVFSELITFLVFYLLLKRRVFKSV